MSIETDTPADTTATDPADPGSETPEAAPEAGNPMEITDEAMTTVMSIRNEEADSETLSLRVEITGTNGREYTYDLSFASPDEVARGHHRYSIGELMVAIESESVERLTGAQLDVPRNAGQGGLVIRNPNTPDPFEGIDIELVGEIPDKVSQLLEQQINPMLASHGGFAQFVGADENNNVYVTMGGGCQGCAASAATLRDGIRTAIMDAIPEVKEVIDTTDHEAGENPFYT